MTRPSRRLPPTHPVLKAHLEGRQRRVQARVADAITAFAGSLPFVYAHLLWFTVWIAAGIEAFPYGLLTMIVSLEAIFVSAFIMISQNRTDERRQMLANAEWELVQQGDLQNQLEVKQNAELLELSRQILKLTTELHELRLLGPMRAAPDRSPH